MNKELYELLYDADVIQRIPVSLEEYKATPQERQVDIISDTDPFLIYDQITDKDDLKLMLSAKQTCYLKTIKSCIIFFTTIIILSVVCSFFLLMQ